MRVKRAWDVPGALPPWPGHYFTRPTPETLQECRRGMRAVRLQRVPYTFGVGEKWSVQWWTFGLSDQGQKTPQWTLTHEDVKADLLHAAVRYARAEAVLTRRKSVRT